MHTIASHPTSERASLGMPVITLPPTAPSPAAAPGSQQLEGQVKRAEVAIRALSDLKLPPQAQPHSQWSATERLASIDLIFQQVDAEGCANWLPE